MSSFVTTRYDLRVVVSTNRIIAHSSIQRTPDNLYPDERFFNPISGWNCDDLIPQDYAGGTAPVYHETIIPECHPFASQIWPGTCDAGQLTREGLEDAVKHGQVRSLIFLTCY